MSRDGSDISKQEVNNDHVIFEFLFTSCWGIWATPSYTVKTKT